MPIIGDPIILSGGVMSPNDAILRVQAPAGSTVTISKGSVSLTGRGIVNADDPTLEDNYFFIKQAQFDSGLAWMVSAISGSKIATSQVVIDSAEQYTVILRFRFYLYKDGIFNVAMKKVPTRTAQKNVDSYTVYADYFRLGCSGANYSSSLITEEAIDLTHYTRFVVNARYSGTSSNIKGIYVSTQNTYPETYSVASATISSTTYVEVVADITSLANSYYLAAGVSCSSSTSAVYIYVTEIYIDQ